MSRRVVDTGERSKRGALIPLPFSEKERAQQDGVLVVVQRQHAPQGQ